MKNIGKKLDRFEDRHPLITLITGLLKGICCIVIMICLVFIVIGLS